MSDLSLPSDPELSSQPSVVTANSHSNWTLRGIILLGILLSILTLGYFIYWKPTHPVIKIDQPKLSSRAAAQLLKDPETIAFTKGNNIFLSNLKGKEIPLITNQPKLTEKIALLKISPGRRFITWQSSSGIWVFDADRNQASPSVTDIPRQAYDLSPLADKILFLTSKEIKEVDLATQSTTFSLLLPKLTNPKATFNQVNYSPDGRLAYIRSIHECCSQGPEDAILDLENKKITFLDQTFSSSVNLAPLWSNDSKELLTWKGIGLTVTNLAENTTKVLIPGDNFPTQGPYAINPTDKSVAFVTGLRKKRDGPNNITIFLADSSGKKQSEVINGLDQKLGNGEYQGSITDIGWLNEDKLWFTFNLGSTVRDLWIISKNGDDATKVLSGINGYSLNSVYAPVVLSYTLFK